MLLGLVVAVGVNVDVDVIVGDGECVGVAVRGGVSVAVGVWVAHGAGVIRNTSDSVLQASATKKIVSVIQQTNHILRDCGNNEFIDL